MYSRASATETTGRGARFGMTKTTSMPACRMVGVTSCAMGPGALRRWTCMSAAAGRTYESFRGILTVWRGFLEGEGQEPGAHRLEGNSPGDDREIAARSQS